MKQVALCILALAFIIAEGRAGEPSGEKQKKPPTPKSEKHDGKGSMFAFVCLKKNTMPDAKAIESSFKKWFAEPDEANAKVEVDAKKESVAFIIGKKSAVIGLMPRPIPGDDIPYASENSFLWPSAAKELKNHQAHLIVVAIGDYKERYERDLFLTRVIAACTEAFPTAGVYWGDAAIVHSPDMFRKEVVTKIEKAEDVPAFLWVGFLREKHDDGTVSVYTKGLDRFGCMDLEVVRSHRKPSEIFSLLHGTSQYLIYEGNVIKDGDTVGDEKWARARKRRRFRAGGSPRYLSVLR